MTDQTEQPNEDTTERDAEIMRSHKICCDALDAAFEAISEKKVLVEVLISMLIYRAATVARQEDLRSGFMRAIGSAVRIVNEGDQVEVTMPRNKTEFDKRCEVLIEGISITARLNAAANGIEPDALPLVLMESAAIVAAEDRGRAGALELVESMRSIVAKHDARKAERSTKH